MIFNKEIGKQFYETQIGVKENTGAGTELMRKQYNPNLRHQPKSATERHLARQNKLLRDALEKANRK